MAGERSNSSGFTEIAGAHQMHGDGLRVPDGGRGKALNNDAGKGGKLRLSRPALFKRKPYDRPVHPGAMDHPLSSGLNGQAPSLPARLMDSASNLITSSASYLFESFFKRRQTRWIGNGFRSTERTDSAVMEHKEGSKPPTDNSDKQVVTSLPGPALEACREGAGGEDLDLAKVEGILKQQFLSREEVKRLTDALQNQTRGGNMVGSNIEAYRGQEKTKQVGEELNLVQIAKAFMGERTSQFVSTTQYHSTPYRYGEGAGPSSIKRIKDEVYERSTGQPSKAHLASAERMLKRRLIADEEDNVIPRGPTRRVRQRMTIMANTSPYIRQVTSASGPLRTSSTPLLQLSERTEKVEEALEKSVPTAKGKSVEEPAVAAACDYADSPESSRARENLETFSRKDSCVLPTSSDLDNSSCKPAVEPVATIASKAAEESAIGSLAAVPSELLPTVIPERTKGFHMSAFFEDSSSDEDSGPPLMASTSSEGQRPGPSSSQGALQENTMKQPSAFISNDGSFSSAADSTIKSPPLLLQPSIADLSPSTLASTLAMGKSIPLLSNMKPLPVISHAPSATEREFLPFTPPASAGAPASVVLSTPPISVSTSRPTPLAPTSVSFSVQGAMVAMAPSSSAAEVEPPLSMSKEAAAEGVAAEVSAASPPAVTRVAETASIVAPSFTSPVTASKSSVALVTTAARVSPVGSVESLAAVPAIVPVVFQAGTGGAQVDGVTAADSFLKVGSGVTFTTGSPGAERQGEGDTMATDPMTEEPDSSFVPSSASPFLFGSASTAPTSLGQMPSFGSGAASTSAFSFPMPASAPSGVSSSTQFPFSSQSSSTAGQLFTFGASGMSPSNPFSVNTQSSFSFGSSSATSASPVFTATTSAPLTFPAMPAAPSFQFGGHAASSSSTSSSSMFGAQMTPSASAFAAPQAQSNASAFIFSTPITSSGTPTPPTFQFGGAGASGPSFGGQSLTFGGQTAVTAGNPFAQSGASNTAPFQFGSSAATPSQSAFSVGATAPSTLSFGAQPSGSPFPFAFGSQPGAPPSGQQFSFGAQPGAPPSGQQFSFGAQPAVSTATGQIPFASAGASGMEFGGGFSLGATGGERSGRKFIKARRIGGPKRGK